MFLAIKNALSYFWEWFIRQYWLFIISGWIILYFIDEEKFRIIKDQQWLFIIAGWFVVYRLNLGLQTKTKKQTLEIETAFEMIEKLKNYNESMYRFVREAEHIKRDLEAFDMKLLVIFIRTKILLDPLKEACKDNNLCYANYHFYYKSRQLILFDCKEGLNNLDSIGFTVYAIFNLIHTELDLVRLDTDREEFPELNKEDLIRRIEEGLNYYKQFKAQTEKLFIELQNRYLSNMFGEKRVKDNKPNRPFYLNI